MASDILSRVQILLDANTARFEQGMRNAQETASSTFGKISDGAKKMTGVVAAAAVVGATALISYGNEHIKVIDELEKYAYLSDATFENFQKMAVGAQALGIESDQLSDMYKDFNEKLGEFNTVGAGGALDFFEQVALKTEGSSKAALKLMKDMADLSGPEGLELYVKKMEEVGLSQEQMSFLMESMASDTTALIPLLINSAEGMNLWADAGERAGVIINDQTREAAKALKVEIKLLDMQMEGAKNQVMQALLPAMVDIASAFLTSEGGTISLTSASETLATSLKWLSKTGLGVVAVFDVVGTILGGTAAAMSSADIRAEDVIRDLESKIEGYGEKFNRINGEGGVSDEQKKRLIEIEQQRAKLSASTAKNYQAQTQGLKDFAEKQDEIAKKTDKHAKAKADAANKAKADALKLLYDYGTEFQRIDRDLADESNLIGGSALKTNAKSTMLAEAKEISKARKQVYLLEYEADLDSWQWTEEQKLKKTIALETARIKATKGMSNGEREERIQSSAVIHKHEMAWLQLEQNERLSNAQEAFQTEIQKITSKYEFERERIRLNKSLSADDKEGLIGASMRTQDLDNDDRRKQAWSDFQNAAGVDTSAEDKQSDRNSVFENALNWQLITQEEYQRRLLQSEQQYQLDRTNLTIDSYSGSLDATTGFFKAMLGESSSTYQALFMAQKMFALSQAGMNIYKAASDAFANEPGTVWQKMGAAAMATLEGGTFVAMIEAATPIAHGGLDYVPKETTYLLDEGERVLSPRQNKDFTNFLASNEGNKSGGDVHYTQTIHIASDGSATSESDAKQLGKIVENMTLAVIRKEQRQGGLLSK